MRQWKSEQARSRACPRLGPCPAWECLACRARGHLAPLLTSLKAAHPKASALRPKPRRAPPANPGAPFSHHLPAGLGGYHQGGDSGLEGAGALPGRSRAAGRGGRDRAMGGAAPYCLEYAPFLVLPYWLVRGAPGVSERLRTEGDPLVPPAQRGSARFVENSEAPALASPHHPFHRCGRGREVCPRPGTALRSPSARCAPGPIRRRPRRAGG